VLPVPFALLYLVCLGLSLGAVEAMRDGGVPERATEISEPVAGVTVAMPPRPDGVRPVRGEGDQRFSEKGCRALTGTFRDICFHQLARQRAATDLEGARQACGEIERRRTIHECTADVAELHARTDLRVALAVCPEIPRKKWRDQCVFGIALAMVEPAPAAAFSLCDSAGMWRDFCRHDVNGEIAVRDVAHAMSNCAAEEGNHLTRVSCWHGIGKYIARVDVRRAVSACRQVPAGLYRENCAHGLGWGAAESRGVAMADQCHAVGEVADSCRLGVAYNHRRFDIDAALDVCTGIRRSDLQRQCFTFVRTGVLRGSPG